MNNKTMSGTKCMLCLYGLLTLSAQAGTLLKEIANESVPTSGISTLQSKAVRYEFKLVKDLGWNICRDYVKNLEVVHPTTESLACEATLDPSAQQLGFPKWEELNIEDHLNIVYDIEKNLGGRSRPIPAFDVWRDGYLAKIKSGEIKPRLRRAVFEVQFKNFKRSEGQRDFKQYEHREDAFFGYTRSSDNIETCKKEIAEGRYLSIPRDTGDNLFYLDPTSKTYQQIYPDTGADFFWLNEARLVMHGDTVFLQKSVPRDASDGYDIKFYRIFSLNPNPGMELHYYAQMACEITARPISAAYH